MKPILHSTAALAILAFYSLPGHAQTTEVTPPAPNPAAPHAEGSQALQTRTFLVPPDFLSKGSGPTGDPFAPNSPAKPTAKDVLEQLGITFDAPGSTASFYPKTSLLKMTNTAEQMDNMDELFRYYSKHTVLQGQVHLEVFSLPPLTARKTLIAHPRESELYAWLDAEVAKPESPIKLERHSITIVRGGQRSKTEGIDEIPQATEYDEGQLPQNISLPAAATSTLAPSGNAIFAPWPRTDTTPTTFAPRNAGDTLEVELTFGDDSRVVDLNMAPETARRLGIVKFGLLQDIYQPIYETQKIAAQASGFVGQPMLIGTFSPPMNTGVPGGNTVDRTWLLFVTVKTPE